MSNISTVVDTIYTKLATLLPSEFRIPNAYSLEDNNRNFLEKGYGVIIGDANYEQFEFCNFMVARTIKVVFTREMFRVDAETTQTDAIVKELLENVVAVQKLFYSYDELGIEANIAKVEIGEVSGVETFVADRQNFLSMTASFSFNILESL